MAEQPHQTGQNPLGGTHREIDNAQLFADDIIFSNTEHILFEEDIQDREYPGGELMEGHPQRRYAVLGKISEGGMKVVWEVEDRRTRRKMAMALMREERIASPEDINTFLDEARLTANLQHPHIVPVHDIALDDSGNPYFTMNILHGNTLAHIFEQLREGHPEALHHYPRARLLSTFLKVCNAIEYAHTKGVLHLDIKPSNIMTGDFGDVHVLDWGLATLLTRPGGQREASPGVSADGRSKEKNAQHRRVLGGTPGYMSPEQAQGNLEEVGFHTDIYMLCAVLYEILTLQRPLQGENVDAVLRNTRRGDIVPLRTRGGKPPVALAAIAMKGLAAHPAERYANVAALIHDIHQYQEGYATLAENPGFFTQLRLLIRRHRPAAALLGGTLLITGAILTKSFHSIRTSEAVASNALAELQQKSRYIEATTMAIAPDYLELARQHESRYRFDEARDAFDTCLTFNPGLADAQQFKKRLFLADLRFEEALRVFDAYPSGEDWPALQLALKYREVGVPADERLPALVKDFAAHHLADLLPRLFHQLNQAPHQPSTRMPALQESLQLLNPEAGNLRFSWSRAPEGGLNIDLDGNTGLGSLVPLCGLDIRRLNLNHARRPDLSPLHLENLLELRLANAQTEKLSEFGRLPNLRTLDIGGTRILDLGGLFRFPRLVSLNLSGIAEMDIPPQLLWCRDLRVISVPLSYRADPTIIALARRGVIMAYTDE